MKNNNWCIFSNNNKPDDKSIIVKYISHNKSYFLGVYHKSYGEYNDAIVDSNEKFTQIKSGDPWIYLHRCDIYMQ